MLTNGNEKLCSASLEFLLLKITRCVVKYIRPFLEPLNKAPSCPENSIMTLSENIKILIGGMSKHRMKKKMIEGKKKHTIHGIKLS